MKEDTEYEYDQDSFQGIEEDEDFDGERSRRQREDDGSRSKNKGVIITIFVMVFLLLATAAFVGGDNIRALLESVLPKNQEAGIVAEVNAEEDEQTAFTEGGTIPQITIESSAKTAFVGYDKNFLYCTKDGIKFYDINYNTVWSYTHTLISPLIITDGNVTAVGDFQGYSLRVYNDKGELYALQTEGAILKVNVNRHGDMGVILKTEQGYKIQAYNSTGQLLMERIEQDTGVYPVALDLSADKKVMAVSYLDTTGIEIVGKVLLFYTTKADALSSETGDFFASIEKSNTLVTMIEYMENGSFVAVGDNALFAADVTGKELWSIPLYNKVDALSFGAERYVVIAYGEALVQEGALQAGTVAAYDSNGKEKIRFEMGSGITYLRAHDNGVVIGSQREFIGINYNKSVQWSHTAIQDVKEIIPLNNQNTVIYVTNSFARVVDMKKING